MEPEKRRMNKRARAALAGIPEKSRRRIELIFMVKTGQLTATEAARQMGVSRKTYYKWEKRVMEAGLRAAEGSTLEQSEQTLEKEQEIEKERLRKEGAELRRQIAEMEKEIAKRRAEFRETLQEVGIIRPRKT